MRVRRSIGRTILNGRQPMSFFSSITSVFHSTENTETPVSATFASRKDTVYAPISGMLVDQKEINDEVISQGLLGKGYGILPVGNVVYAPVSGRVDVVTVTNHAIGILSETGAKVLIHVGLGPDLLDTQLVQRRQIPDRFRSLLVSGWKGPQIRELRLDHIIQQRFDLCHMLFLLSKIRIGFIIADVIRAAGSPPP